MSNIIRLTQSITFETANAIYEDMLKTLDNDYVILEMSGVESCDSAGIAVLIEIKKQAIKKNVDVKLVEVSQQVIDLASFLKVDDILFAS